LEFSISETEKKTYNICTYIHIYIHNKSYVRQLFEKKT
jgi:hypothetical protein